MVTELQTVRFRVVPPVPPKILQLTPSFSLPSERGDAGFASAVVTLSAKPMGLESGRKEERFLKWVKKKDEV